MSNTKLLHRLRAFDNSQSFKNLSKFWDLLRKLCDAHDAYPFVSLIRNGIGDWKESMRVADLLSSQKYDDYKTHFVANQFSLLVRKHPLAKIHGLSPRDNALAKFKNAEHRCKWVNRKFRLFTKRSPYEAQLQRMRDFIQYVLGPVPSDSDIAREAGFGPGASIGIHGATNFARKILAESWSCTPGAFDIGFNVIVNHPILADTLRPVRYYNQAGTGNASWSAVYDTDSSKSRNAYHEKVTCTRHNKIVFVPKTAKVLRTIAVEPLINGYVQKGIDILIRKRLKRIGISLDSQLTNQLYARFGSEDWKDENGFCTLDLESASDSISLELVRTVLPNDWFDLLNRCRSKEGKVDKEHLVYEKFCSMGNGFCFPLETLIFASICHAAGAGKPRHDYVVFGDDIIVRKPYVEGVIKLLRTCGFRLNHAKSHFSGPFRESCGEDFFGGIAVRPFTLDFGFDSLNSIIKFLNLVRRNPLTKWFFEDIDYSFFDVPPDLRFVRPSDGNADAAVTVELDVFMSSPFAKWNKNLWCWEWYELEHTPRRDDWWIRHETGHIAQVYAALAGASSSMPFAFRRETKTKVRRMAYSATHISWDAALLAA